MAYFDLLSRLVSGRTARAGLEEPVSPEVALREISESRHAYLSVLALRFSHHLLFPGLWKEKPHLVLSGTGSGIAGLLEKESFDVAVRSNGRIIGNVAYPGIGSFNGRFRVVRVSGGDAVHFSFDASEYSPFPLMPFRVERARYSYTVVVKE